uniref:Transmembrane protein 52B n=1 Tax=Macrostomum lignano TaxID=282301 RepID=A0A1I8FT80_9PLAT
MSMLGYAILTCLGLLFIIIVPLAGCCVFCCRCCCGKCGGRLHHMERKGARCRRNCYGTSLTVLCTVMLCRRSPGLHLQPAVRNAMDPKRPDYVFLQATKSLGLAAAELSAAPDRARNDSGRVRTLTAAVVRPAVAGAARKFRDHLIARRGRGGQPAVGRLWPAGRRTPSKLAGSPRRPGQASERLLRDRLAVMKPGGDFDAAPAQCNSQLSSWLPVGDGVRLGQPASRSLSETEASLAGARGRGNW